MDDADVAAGGDQPLAARPWSTTSADQLIESVSHSPRRCHARPLVEEAREPGNPHIACSGAAQDLPASHSCGGEWSDGVDLVPEPVGLDVEVVLVLQVQPEVR